MRGLGRAAVGQQDQAKAKQPAIALVRSGKSNQAMAGSPPRRSTRLRECDRIGVAQTLVTARAHQTRNKIMTMIPGRAGFHRPFGIIIVGVAT